MKNLTTISLFLMLTFKVSGVTAQDLVGQSHKQVLEYWQKSVPSEQITDNNDLLVINGTTFCSFKKNLCVEYTTTIAASQLEKYRMDLNENTDLQYDLKTDSWINAAKKYSWKYTKVSDNEYELSCKKL